MRWTILVLLLLPKSLIGQTSSPSIEEQLLALELELDSISLFSFLDSLLLAPRPASEINVRLGYSSSRLSAGRDFNLEQKGYTTGLAYYHSSGLYTDFSTFYDMRLSPAAYISMWHLGYFWLPNLKWSINPYYEHTFNHQNLSNDLSNSLGTSVTRTTKWADVGMDYAFLWGKQHVGHRVIPSVSKKFRLKHVPWVKSVTFYPSISLTAGTTGIFTYLYSSEQIDTYLLRIQELTDDEIRLLVVSGRITTAEAIQLRITRRLLNEGSEADREYLKELLNTLVEEDAFALLSYTISLPVTITINKTMVQLSYSYAIPQPLPGEDLGVDPSGFFNISINQRLTWERK